LTLSLVPAKLCQRKPLPLVLIESPPILLRHTSISYSSVSDNLESAKATSYFP
jgi:hypothetical protein